jgi:hypothetical protein
MIVPVMSVSVGSARVCVSAGHSYMKCTQETAVLCYGRMAQLR